MALCCNGLTVGSLSMAVTLVHREHQYSRKWVVNWRWWLHYTEHWGGRDHRRHPQGTTMDDVGASSRILQWSQWAKLIAIVTLYMINNESWVECLIWLLPKIVIIILNPTNNCLCVRFNGLHCCTAYNWYHEVNKYHTFSIWIYTAVRCEKSTGIKWWWQKPDYLCNIL